MKQKPRYRPRIKAGGLIEGWPGDLGSPDELAAKVHYVGSAEHKDWSAHRSFAIRPALRSDASRCDPSISRDEAEARLREAVRRRCVSQEFEGGFPRYVWGRISNVPYVARLVNSSSGAYKGWPIEECEFPSGGEDRLRGGTR